MHETPAELEELQRVLDRSAEAAGPHLRSIATAERRLDAVGLCRRLRGMRLLSVGTVTADGRPLLGAVDGYLLHGSFHFSSSPASVRIRHLSRRPAVSVLHLPGEDLAVTVHGSADLYELAGPEGEAQRAAMLEHYLPRQGEAFAEWLAATDAIGVRVVAERLLTYAAGG